MKRLALAVLLAAAAFLAAPMGTWTATAAPAEAVGFSLDRHEATPAEYTRRRWHRRHWRHRHHWRRHYYHRRYWRPRYYHRRHYWRPRYYY